MNTRVKCALGRLFPAKKEKNENAFGTRRLGNIYFYNNSNRLFKKKKNYFFEHCVGGHVSDVIGVYPRFRQVYGYRLSGFVIGAV